MLLKNQVATKWYQEPESPIQLYYNPFVSLYQGERYKYIPLLPRKEILSKTNYCSSILTWIRFHFLSQCPLEVSIAHDPLSIEGETQVQSDYDLSVHSTHCQMQSPSSLPCWRIYSRTLELKLNPESIKAAVVNHKSKKNLRKNTGICYQICFIFTGKFKNTQYCEELINYWGYICIPLGYTTPNPAYFFDSRERWHRHTPAQRQASVSSALIYYVGIKN